MKIIISGDRNATFDDHGLIIKEFINSLEDDCIIIHGDCRGVDKIAGFYSKVRGLEVQTKAAEWKKHGKAAGPIRNQEMLNEKPDLVVLFHPDIEKSLGTRNMRDIARKANITTKYIKL